MKLFSSLIKNNIFRNSKVSIVRNCNYLNFLKLSKFTKSDDIRNDDMLLFQNKNKIRINQDDKDFKSNENEEEIKVNGIKFEKEYIEIMIKILSKRSKYYAITNNKHNFENMGKYFKFYLYIIENVEFIEPYNLDSLIKSITYFQYKDENSEMLLKKLFDISKDELKKSVTIMNAISKLRINNQDLLNSCLEIIEKIEFKQEDKTFIIQIATSISFMEIENRNISSKIDEFIRINYNILDETELTFMFRYYSFSKNPDFDVLDYLVKRCLELVNKFSIKTIILISKNLAELNLRNLVLLVQLRFRLNTLIEINNQNRIEELKEDLISPDELCQVINYFVRLNFLEPADYIYLENMFFINAAKYGINKDTTSTIIATHCRFMRKIIVEEREENGGKILMKTLRRYKNLNEDFFERILPYVELYYDDFSFNVGCNMFVLIKNSRVVKKGLLRNYLPIYLHLMDKYFKKDEIDKLEFKKVKEFIKMGCSIYDSKECLNKISDKLISIEFDLDKYNIKLNL